MTPVPNGSAMNRPAYSPDETPRAEDILLSGKFDGRHFTPRQLRLLRKEMLSLRAAVERAEISHATHELRGTLLRFSWIKWLMPRWMGVAGERGAISVLLKQYPLLGSLASIALNGPLRNMAVRLARPGLKVGIAALTGWSLWQVWQAVKTPEAALDEADSPTLD
jgi:hypothetical protein